MSTTPQSVSASTGALKAKLGEHEYAIYPQRIGRLENRLKGFFGQLTEASVDAALIGSSGYRLLEVFVPDLMPEHEFRGYADQTAFEAGAYDEAKDRSPSPDQIVDAFRLAMKVNRFDLFEHIKKVVSPELLKSFADTAVAEAMLSRTGGTSANGSSTITPPTT